MKNLAQTYSDLRFSESQLYFSDEEYETIAKEFFGNKWPTSLTNKDRAFLQAAFFIAVDKSEKAAFVFSIYKAFVSAAPSQSIKKLAQKLVMAGAKHAFSDYIDDDPKYSAAGRAGVQYSAFATEWKLRVGLDDTSFLTNFLKY